MDKRKVNAILATMIQALDHAGGNYPNGHLYAAMMNVLDLNTYNALLGILIKADLVENVFDELRLTSKGEAMAQEITALEKSAA